MCQIRNNRAPHTTTLLTALMAALGALPGPSTAQTKPPPAATAKPQAAAPAASAASATTTAVTQPGLTIKPAAGTLLLATAAPNTGAHGLPTVALDMGRAPAAGPAAAGQAEYAYNQRVAEQLERALLSLKIAVKRIPAGLSPTQRANAAAGSTLLVSVNHEVVSKHGMAAQFVGFGLAVSRLQAPANLASALACARYTASALIVTGRRNSLLQAGTAISDEHAWADTILGVQAQDGLAVLRLAPVPAMRLQVVVATNPRESQHMQNATWTRAQAQAVAQGLSRCLKDISGA